MKHKLTVALAAVAISSGLIVAYADAPQSSVMPGSVDDPIITKSYFDQHISEKIAEELSKLQGGAPAATPDQSSHPEKPSSSSSASELIVIQLENGQTLYGEAGTEIIVRSGQTVAVSKDDGLADVTSGKDIAAGGKIELNHLLIVPRDGRGIKPDAKNKQEIFVMVRGNYKVVDADGTTVAP